MWLLSSRFLSRLRARERKLDERRPELVVATSRAVLAAIALFSAYIDPTSPAHFVNVVRLLLAAYLLHSVAVWVRVKIGHVSTAFVLLLHLLDIAFPVAASFFSGGPESPFFLFLPFAIVWSAFRWGAIESIATASATIVVLVAETFLMSLLPGVATDLVLEPSEINRMLLRCVYLAMLGAMLGMLGEREKEWRAEDSFVNRMLHGIRAERGMSETMLFVIRELLHLYRGKTAVVVIEGLTNGRFYQIEVHRNRPSEHPGFVEIFGEEGRLRMLPDRPAHFFATGEGHDSEISNWLALDSFGQVQHLEVRSPLRFLNNGDIRQSVLCVSLQFGTEWAGRLFLIGAQLGPKREDELRFAARLIQSVSPAVYSVYLVRRLRNRVGAIERARVARELHDGAIQSLISIEMQVDVLKRQAAELSPTFSGDLSRIQQLLQKQVLEIRELMYQLRPADIMPNQLLDFMGNTIERFRRDTGIEADFETQVPRVDLSPQQCRELARILQEGLVNVRKHSSATKVLVELQQKNGNLLLTIEDDGKGFGFSGTLNSQELTASRLGPTMIQERVRSISGELEIESDPGHGSKLKVLVPRKVNRTHG